jgi:hypothetical protein
LTLFRFIGLLDNIDDDSEEYDLFFVEDDTIDEGIYSLN